MGWERKRGKLHELNRLLRGVDDTSFMAARRRDPSQVPEDVQYVITLDADISPSLPCVIAALSGSSARCAGASAGRTG